MISWDTFKKYVYTVAAGTALLVLMVYFGLSIYQPATKTDEIYSQALKEYNAKNYSQAYYLFSKVNIISDLKPLAIYHQGVAATDIDDVKSAEKQYKFFLMLYPKHMLSIKVRYNLAQIITDSNPQAAKKHFEYIINKFPHSDYAIASEYYLGHLMLKKYEGEKIFPLSAKEDIQNHFRHYLKKAPAGRLAMSVINDWNKIDATISKDDYLLMAKSSYKLGDYKKADELSKKSEVKNSRAFDVINAKATGNNARIKFLTEWGLKGNADYIEKEDVYEAIDAYMSIVPSKYQAAINLLGIAKSRGKDYLMVIKCRYGEEKDRADCYKNLYLWYPSSDFTAEAQAKIFLDMVNKNNIPDAQRIGIDFLNKYKNDQTYAPIVMYYMGRVSERAKAYQDYVNYYRGVISRFPDSYYAFRAFVRLKNNKTSIIATGIKEKPIEFPYERRHYFLDKLVSLGDWDVLDEYTSYDEFLKSWALYQKGENSHAMLIARNAMDKLEEKPHRSDLRWRLVYPVFFYEQIRSAADRAGVNAPLMLGLTREESYFNPNAQSSVGARGLMQLMPTTGADTAFKHGITGVNLFNPDMNVVLGCYHYAAVRSQLDGIEISSVAAYNSGVGAVKQWKQSLNYFDPDLFTEQIPYPETREYVKKVFRSYWNYVRIYE